MTWATAVFLATLQVWLISNLTTGVAYRPVGEAPKCCSSLTAIDTLLGMMQGFKDEVKTLTTKVESGGQNLDLTNNKQLQAMFKTRNLTINTLAKKMSKLENKLDAQPVAFLAELSKDLVNPAEDHTVVFDVIHLNDGNAYSNNNGIFTTPVAGVYHFTLELSTPLNLIKHHRIHVRLMKSKTPLAYVFLDDNDDRWLKRSAAATVHLAKGDEILAKVTHRNLDGTIAGCCFHSVFSGFLIHAD